MKKKKSRWPRHDFPKWVYRADLSKDGKKIFRMATYKLIKVEKGSK